MNAPFNPIQTAADLLSMLEQANLSPIRKRDLMSAINRVSTMVGCPPVALRLEVSSLRARLAAIRPAAHRVEPGTFANIHSLFVAALEMAGTIERCPRDAARHDPTWAPLVAAISGDKALAKGLATFMNWCAWTGIEPASVDDSVLQDFLHRLETRTLHRRPRDLVRRIPALWEKAQALVPEWPATQLTRISFRPISPNLRWDELPEGLRTDTEAYLAGRAEPDLLDDSADAPPRPLAPSTISLQADHIRLAASILVRNGIAVEDLTGLASLVAIDAVKMVLTHYVLQANKEPNAFAVGVGVTLIHIARYYVKVPAEHLDRLRKIVRKVPAIAFDLTRKNKALLADLENEAVRARLLCLPEMLAREVKRDLAKGLRLKFVEAQIAAAVDILIVAPLRPKNLSGLNWRRNFREPNGPKGKLVIFIPKDATKTKRRDLTFEVPAEMTETIRWYRREILPLLEADPFGDLFVSKGGRRKSQETLSQQLTETIAEKVGIHMTPHQFRHLAAVLYLEAHPEDFQTVSDLLGHAFAKSTLVYAGSSSRRASRAFGQIVIEQRAAAALKQRFPRRRTR